MADEPVIHGSWLPPRAPGAQPPPRFDRRPQPDQPPASPRLEPPTVDERNQVAVWGMVLGIVGIALLVLSLGSLFIVTLPCSIAAWVLGAQARGRIERGETAHGAGQATAALWLGRIGVIVGVAATVAFIALLAAGFDFEQFRDDLQRDLERRRNSGEGVRAFLQGCRRYSWPPA